MSLDKVLGGLGRIFIGAGILVFLFVAYQLWGTNIAEARNQDHLKNQAKTLFAQANNTDGTTTTTVPLKPGETAPPNTTPAPPPTPTGEAVAVIKIPKINLTKAVVEGTGVPDLKKGPGHYLNTPLPGQPGNAAIAGHRTTYGAPFGDIGELAGGDEIDVTTKQGTFVYKVAQQKVVSPSDVSVLNATKDNRLTLTTCNPKYSAAQRLVVIAELAPGVSAAPASPPTTVAATTATTKPGATTTTTSANDLDGADLSGTSNARTPAVIWGIGSALVFISFWVLSKRWNRWLSYAIGTPVFLVVLFFFFENFALLLPANA